MGQVDYGRLVDWLVEGVVLYPLSEMQAEAIANGDKVNRVDLSKTSLRAYGRTPQEAIERFLKEFSGDVRVTGVHVV